MDIWQTIELAKQHLDTDPHLANFILRDLPEVKELGLDDLAWAMHKEHPHKNDVLYLIELLEHGLTTAAPDRATEAPSEGGSESPLCG
jgi:hypothetical protein